MASDELRFSVPPNYRLAPGANVIPCSRRQGSQLLEGEEAGPARCEPEASTEVLPEDVEEGAEAQGGDENPLRAASRIEETRGRINGRAQGR